MRILSSAARSRLAALLATGCACASVPPRFSAPLSGAIHAVGLRGIEGTPLRGARLFPEKLDEAQVWGVVPGGGIRGIVAGIRIVATEEGAMEVAEDRLPATPSSVVALPERLGGGFLFGIGAHLWRSSAWLGAAKAFFTSPAPVAEVLVGLDRVYLRSPRGGLAAIDPRTGDPMDLGPLPESPNVGRLAALDGWRAVAIADLRGAMLTIDAGSSWRRLALPIEPSDVAVLEDTIAIGGLNDSRKVEWWELRSDGQTGKRSFAPRQSGGLPEPSEVWRGRGQNPDSAARAFGPQPLESAIEDGWPMTDGTALVARDGALARVRLSDGALVESVDNAFPLRPARCHAISLAHPGDPGAPGFVCGEAQGRTAVYRWDPPSGRLEELRRFATPREVLSFGNGAIAVRGPCAAGAVGNAVGSEQPWCLKSWDGPWKDAHFATEERLVLLSDGRVVLVRPPRGGDLSTARLTTIDSMHASQVPIVVSAPTADAARALRMGIWMDGFEERRPGVVGGWVEAAGSLVGIEIATAGEARVGEYIRDAGAPVASGRWAFGWTASRRGFESTDGGMTWAKEIALPDPIASGRAIHERVCGPIGCIAAGWLRVGWGVAGGEPSAELPMRAFPMVHSAPKMDLDCEAMGGSNSATELARPGAARRALSEAAMRPGPSASTYSLSTWGTVSEFVSFAGRPATAMPADNLGLSVEASNGIERALRQVPLARIYAWGPKTGDWDQLGRWQVLWQWPWGSWRDVRSSLAVATPWTSLDGTRRALGIAPGTPTVWAVAEGGDPDHELLIAHRGMASATAEIIVLEADRPPVVARRSNGEPLGDVEGATRMGGRWYIATTESPGEATSTIVWALDGSTVRELVRVPRAGFEARPALRLATHTDGRTIGLVVDGQPNELRGTTARWVAGIDVESNSVATPEPLAPVDLSDRTVSLCTGNDAGWEVDVPYSGTVRLRVGAGWEAALQAPIARMRLSRERACIERVLGSIDAYASSPPEALTTSATRGRPGVRRIDTSVFAARMRYRLRCAARASQL